MPYPEHTPSAPGCIQSDTRDPFSIATELYRRTKDLALVKDFLGHAHIAITDQFYRGTSEDQIKRDVLTAMDAQRH